MRKLVFIVFVVVSYLIFRPIVPYVWYPMHDTTSVSRTYLLERTLLSGQVPAVWSAELNGGEGYPLFHFYAPAMTYLSLLGKSLTGSYFIGIKLTLILSSLIGMIGMYFLTRKYGRLSGLVAAISYALLPYAAVNLYVRGAYAEYLSMCLLPWLFYAWQNLSTRRSQLFAVAATTLFLLSHNLIPLITSPFLLVWVYLHHKSNFKVIILPTILTILLSAFYLLPLIFERSFVMADQIAQTTNYAKHFVLPTQLWNSSWGYGGSDVGIEDGMSFKIGKIPLTLALITSVFLLIKRKRFEHFYVISAILAASMTTSYSAFIWQSIPYLKIIQFPWRFLALVGFFVSILAGYSLLLIKNNLLKLLASIVIIIAIFLTSLKLFSPQTTFPANLAQYLSADYLSTIPAIVPEYQPRWLSTKNPVVTATTVLPYNYYPTWQVKIDGIKVATFPSGDGKLAFQNPAHSTNIIATQSHTMLENIASFISLLTLLLIIKLYVKN